MHIVVNTRFLLKNKLEGIGWFTYETFKRLVINHPEHEFTFLFDRPFDEKFIFAPNVTGKVVHPPARHPYLWHIWFQWRLPRAINKIKPDLFISTDGFLPLKLDCKTLLVIHDLAFEHYPESVPTLVANYYRKNTPDFVRKASRIVAVSEFTKLDLNEQYGTPLSKIDVAHNGVNPKFTPCHEVEQIEIRNKFADGQRYFLFVSAIQPRKNLSRLLAAFDAFEKLYKSGYQLLVVGGHTWIQKEIEDQVAQMSCQSQIKFLGHLTFDDLNGVIASAEALCYVSLFEGFGIPIVEAMHAEVPVICSNVSSMPEVAGDAALLVDPTNEDEISTAMAKIYTQDDLRLALIEKGREQCKKFTWENTATQLWNAIENTVES